MRTLARLAGGAAALAFVAAGTSCGEQSPQPQNKAQQAEPQAQTQPAPKPPEQQAQTQPTPKQPEPQQAQTPPAPKPPEPQQAQTQPAPKQPEPQQAQMQPAPKPPEPQQVQTQPAPKPPEPQQAQTQPAPKPPEPQQPQTQQAQKRPEPQQPGLQQPQAQPSQPSANGGQTTAENLSEGEIRQMQQALERKGFRVGYVDGKLGPMTKRALTQFQRKQGLQQTGMPDQQTLAALGVAGGASTAGQASSGSQAPKRDTTSPEVSPYYQQIDRDLNICKGC
jgi:hypothetical protein